MERHCPRPPSAIGGGANEAPEAGRMTKPGCLYTLVLWFCSVTVTLVIIAIMLKFGLLA